MNLHPGMVKCCLYAKVAIFYSNDLKNRIAPLFGVNGIPSHWKAIRYQVNVESDAPEADIRKVLDLAHNHSHVRRDLEYAFHIERKVKIVKQKTDID